jgi:hypothetical protein
MNIDKKLAKHKKKSKRSINPSFSAGKISGTIHDSWNSDLVFVNLLREQRLKIFLGHGFREILEQVFQVPVGFQSVGLSGFDQAVKWL